MAPASAPYLIRINGHLGATMLSAFPALAPHQHGKHQPVAVSRRICAPAHDIFQVLADPVRHPEFDGSESLRGAGFYRGDLGGGGRLRDEDVLLPHRRL